MRYLKATVRNFINDESPTAAAALAYYGIFSLPPLLFLVVLLAGAIWGREAVQMMIEQQTQAAIGPEAAEQVGTMVAGTDEQAGGGGLGLALSLAALAFAATTAFAQLQFALNRTWGVRPARGGFWNFASKRLVSFLMIIAIAVLALASLVASTVVHRLGDQLPVPGILLQIGDIAVVLLLLTVLIGLLFKYVPDTTLAWADVKAGALLTAGLFVAGKFALGLYLGRAGTTDAFGAAGALALILLWAFYSANILLFGAEFTQVWAREHGRRIRPREGAEFIDPERARELDRAA